MYNKFRKLLCLLLCAVMVWGILPPMAVSAEEPEALPSVTEHHTAPTVNALTESAEDKWHIQNLADLKEAIAKCNASPLSYVDVYYNESEPLVITEDITIPSNMQLYVEGTLQVAQGVTMTLKNDAWVSSSTTQVDGTVKMEDSAGLSAYFRLTVNGRIDATGIFVDIDTKIEGADKIHYMEGWGCMSISAHVYTAKEFYAAIKKGVSKISDRCTVAVVFNGTEDLVLTESFTIPNGMGIQAWGTDSITIDTGCTVTVQGAISTNASVILKGNLVVSEGAYVSIEGNGYLEFAGGKTTGKGGVAVYVDEEELPADNFVNMDTTKYELVQIDGSFWKIYSIEGMTKLANPAAPKWGIRYKTTWDNVNKVEVVTEVAVPYAISFGRERIAGTYLIRGFYEGPHGDEELWYMEWELHADEPISFDIFADQEMPSGNYYFTIQAIGDYETTRSSDVVSSEKFVYTNPDKKLEPVKNVKCENGKLTWDAHPQADLISGYKVIACKVEGDEIVDSCGTWTASTNSTLVPEHILERYGEGTYRYYVMACTADATKATASDAAESNAVELSIPTERRYAGVNRFDTAFKVADAMKKYYGLEKFPAVIVASGANFADALAGSYLASWYGIPILLSFKEKQNNQLKDYIKENLDEDGVVFILGGESAVPKSMETGLEKYEVTRLAGDNRFLTNLAILEQAGIYEGMDILVATGSNFADSLSASAIGQPILLVHKKLSKDQKDFLAKNVKNNRIVILGGENAVNAAVEAEFKALGYDVERIAGANRFETSVKLAETYFGNPQSAVLAYAANYPDGLCGGSLAFIMGAPLILTMDKQASIAAAYADKANIERVVTLGGTGLISDAAVKLILGK